MTNLKSIIILCLAISFHSISGAQTKTTPKLSKDPKVIKILEGIKKDFDNAKSIEITFNMLMEMPDNTSEKQSGVLQQSGNQYYVNTDQFAIINNGKAMWFVNKANKEGQINENDASSGTQMYSPIELLKIYEKDDHNIAITNEYAEKGVSYQQIEFVPLDKSVDYSKARLTVQKGTSKLKEVKFFYRDGSRMSLVIKNVTKNKAIPVGTFTFQASKYPGVYMEDLRN